MKDKLNIFFKLQSQIYRIILFLITVVFIVYIIPKKGKFQYEFAEGKPWKYETLISPFDFLIQKNKSEIEFEKLTISAKTKRYYLKVEGISDSVISNISLKLKDSYPYLYEEGITNLKKIYEPGLINEFVDLNNDSIFLISKNLIKKFKREEINLINNFSFDSISYNSSKDSISFNNIIKLYLKPDIIYDEITTNLNIDNLLSKVSSNKGFVNNGVRIISRGEIIDSQKFSVLQSLKFKFESQIWSKSNFNLVTLGYLIIVGIILFFLFLFLKKNRLNIYLNNTKITFIFLIILIFVSITVSVNKFQPNYIYVVPLCSIPLLVRAFFDSRLGLFIHVLTLLVLAFIVPNSFEFLFLHTIAGIITI